MIWILISLFVYLLIGAILIIDFALFTRNHQGDTPDGEFIRITKSYWLWALYIPLWPFLLSEIDEVKRLFDYNDD